MLLNRTLTFLILLPLPPGVTCLPNALLGRETRLINARQALYKLSHIAATDMHSLTGQMKWLTGSKCHSSLMTEAQSLDPWCRETRFLKVVLWPAHSIAKANLHSCQHINNDDDNNRREWIKINKGTGGKGCFGNILIYTRMWKGRYKITHVWQCQL